MYNIPELPLILIQIRIIFYQILLWFLFMIHFYIIHFPFRIGIIRIRVNNQNNEGVKKEEIRMSVIVLLSAHMYLIYYNASNFMDSFLFPAFFGSGVVLSNLSLSWLTFTFYLD
jgi:hypothetical protein